MNRFQGKAVIVTGAASGFGAAIARRFAGEGASVLCADLDLPGAEALAGALPVASAFKVDVAEEAQNAAMVAACIERYGTIDVLCCNAGIPHRSAPMVKLSVEDFDLMWAVNVRSIFLAARAAVPHMTEGGSIISTASIGGKRPRPGLTAYNASKGAVITLTKGLAVELAPKVRVNCVCPVSSPTNFDVRATGYNTLPDEMEQAIVAGIPMARRAAPEDVANAYAYLASAEASFLTGLAMDIDGGRSIQ